MLGPIQPPEPPAVTEPSQDEAFALLCPTCDYNLTGLLEDRCPECGAAFDRKELMDPAAGPLRPILPPSRGAVTFTAICVAALFFPRRLACEFPAVHDEIVPFEHSVRCYLLAPAFFALPPLVLGGHPGLIACVTAAAIVGASICDALTAGLWTWWAKPRNAARPSHFWRGITRCTSTFFPVTGLWGGLFFSLNMSPPIPFPLLGVNSAEVVGWFGPVLFCWWACSMSAIVRARSRAGAGIASAMIVPWITGAISIFVGVATFGFVGLLFMRVLF